MRERWRLYIESVCGKDGKLKTEVLQIEEEEEVEEDDKGPIILKSKMLSAVSEMKEGKTVEMDEIPAEMLKNPGENVLREVCDICQNMYHDGKWPGQKMYQDRPGQARSESVPGQKMARKMAALMKWHFIRAAVIHLPKKNTIQCSDMSIISLICHASKFTLRLLTKRIKAKTKHLLN